MQRVAVVRNEVALSIRSSGARVDRRISCRGEFIAPRFPVYDRGPASFEFHDSLGYDGEH
jgi:hypothetical protein